ncbi:ABC transporter ATP-binding protein [Cesiribacter sp. SM1]|uniref:ABC transporter ATP-binding protein n=1 Tax=Cesiribacter sp. SM1 TaxID=2861196 RepID=UPI001CD37B1F|nr:ABC transporter ATP-binding protein [Cesiribacter sp. SM1]
MLKAENITKSYGALQVLKGINLHVEQGQIVSIVGASGAGKSTLLHILGTLDVPDGGMLYINNQRLHNNMKAKDLNRFRNKHIGFIFQFHNLLPEFTALENVAMPAFIAGDRPEEQIKNDARLLLERLGLAQRLHHKPGQMSGGEQQRVAVARALINKPAIVFADEPSGNLDSHSAEELHKLFFDLRQELNQTFVIVTHNEQLADMADFKYEIEDGVIL